MIEYLTEKTLGEFLGKLFPNVNDFVHDKAIKESGIRNRPDYVSQELMLIVEFDGYQHFNQAVRQKSDALKQKVYSEMGYKVIRIPYYVQLSTSMIKHYFDIDYEIEQQYPHGFISDVALRPEDFNLAGLIRLGHDLNTLPKDISDQIKSTFDPIYFDDIRII